MWGYNMMDALERFRWDADCGLFFKVLTRDVPEETYHDQMYLITYLSNLFVQLDLIRQTRKSQVLGINFIRKALRAFFPNKDEGSFETLVRSLEASFKVEPRTNTDYSHLFVENRNLSQSEFLEEVRAQHLFEIDHFNIELKDAVLNLPTTPEGKVSVQDIQVCWITIDKLATMQSITAHVANALFMKRNRVDPQTLVEPGYFCDCLFSSHLVKKHMNYFPPAIDRLPVSMLSLNDAINKKLDMNDFNAGKSGEGGIKAIDKRVLDSMGVSVSRTRTRFGLSPVNRHANHIAPVFQKRGKQYGGGGSSNSYTRKKRKGQHKKRKTKSKDHQNQSQHQQQQPGFTAGNDNDSDHASTAASQPSSSPSSLSSSSPSPSSPSPSPSPSSSPSLPLPPPPSMDSVDLPSIAEEIDHKTTVIDSDIAVAPEIIEEEAEE